MKNSLGLKGIYNKNWISITKNDCKEVKLSKINNSFFENPFDHLPKKITLNNAEVELLKKLETQNGWTGQQFLTLSKLQQKKREKWWKF